jgi:hypothetical protein
MAKENKYTLNKVEGFNPYEHIEEALDAQGNVIISQKTGKSLKYISTKAKTLWFRLKYPEGSIITYPGETIETPEGYPIKYVAEIKIPANSEPLAILEHQIIAADINDIDTAISKCQTIATGKALSKAGFGCEIELMLDMIVEGEEIEESSEPKPKAKRGRPKKTETSNKIEEKAEPSAIDEGDQAILDMLAGIEAETRIETEVEAEEQEQESDLMDEVLVLTDKATNTTLPFAGLTFREAIAKNSKIIEMMQKSPRVRNSFDEHTLQVAEEIAKAL